MTTVRAVAVMLDGTKHEATGVLMPLGDRVAFERKYAASILQIARAAQDVIGEDGQLKAPVPSLNEEREAFFVWRVLARGGCDVGEFDAFVDGCESLEIEALKGELDPTQAGPLPGN